MELGKIGEPILVALLVAESFRYLRKILIGDPTGLMF